jgi:integrase
MRFNKEALKALTLPAGKSEHFEWDDELPGFGVRLRKTAKGRVSCVWIAQYRIGTQQRRPSIGDIRKVRLVDACKIARQHFAQVKLGIDPAAEKAKARIAAAAAKLNVGAVVARYLEARADIVRSSTLTRITRCLTVQWASLADHPLDTVKRADVAAGLQEITKQNGRVSSAKARHTLAAFYSWSMREGLCDANPVLGTNDPAAGIPSRDRVLNDEEIKEIWRACKDDDFGRIIKLLLLSGCRRSEIGGLKWDEINLSTGALTIPSTRTKNGCTLQLTLPPVAMNILRTVVPNEDRNFVFGIRGNGYRAWSKPKTELDERIGVTTGAPLRPWRLHDLRRSMRTGLGCLGVEPHVAERVIGHVKGGIEAVYDRHRYEREIARALALWSDHVMAIVEEREQKIVSLRSV